MLFGWFPTKWWNRSRGDSVRSWKGGGPKPQAITNHIHYRLKGFQEANQCATVNPKWGGETCTTDRDNEPLEGKFISARCSRLQIGVYSRSSTPGVPGRCSRPIGGELIPVPAPASNPWLFLCVRSSAALAKLRGCGDVQPDKVA
jgi:hypothetical protein